MFDKMEYMSNASVPQKPKIFMRTHSSAAVQFVTSVSPSRDRGSQTSAVNPIQLSMSQPPPKLSVIHHYRHMQQ